MDLKKPLMLLPVATAVITALDDGVSTTMDLKKPLMLGLAYSASVGGIGTIVGTGTNGVLVAVAAGMGIDISFVVWSSFAMPFSILMVFFVWVYFVVLYRIPFTPLPPTHPLFQEVAEGPGP